jgi:hypothetical protein
MTYVDFSLPHAGQAIAGRRMIVLEINEISHRLLGRWMADGTLPNFARLHRQSDVFTTMSDETDPVLLEPWIQWYSIHTGLPYAQHGVFHLTDGRKGTHEDVFAMMMAAGHRVASFSSMNVAPFARPGSIYLGDPWCEEGDAYPPELNTYNRFVSSQVREHSNVNAAMTGRDYAAFAAFAARHGLSAGTVTAILGQLSGEKLGDPRRSWRRVTLLDRLNTDVFAHAYARALPDFASFFSNSIAHLQHSYWRYMDPSAFTLQPSAEETTLYGNAIRFAYRETDHMLGRFMALAERHGATLMLVSALGQKPFLRYEGRGGQFFHRLHDGAAFVRDAGIAAREVVPTMTHQYMARFASPEAAAAARARLETFQLADGTPVFGFTTVTTDPCDLYFGCQISQPLPPDAVLVDGRSGIKAEFSRYFYLIDGMKSGCHDPEGCLWIQSANGRGRVHEELVSILDVLPTQLALMGVAGPGGITGRDLSPLLARAPVPA